jgi:hypothetical protein
LKNFNPRCNWTSHVLIDRTQKRIVLAIIVPIFRFFSNSLLQLLTSKLTTFPNITDCEPTTAEENTNRNAAKKSVLIASTLSSVMTGQGHLQKLHRLQHWNTACRMHREQRHGNGESLYRKPKANVIMQKSDQIPQKKYLLVDPLQNNLMSCSGVNAWESPGLQRTIHTLDKMMTSVPESM